MNDNHTNAELHPDLETEPPVGLINTLLETISNLLERNVPPRHLVYPLTTGFGYDEDPPLLSLANVGLDHEVFDPGPRGAGPFEATARATADEDDRADEGQA